MFKNQHGGIRQGSGRKPKFNSPTVVKRIPEHLIPVIESLIKNDCLVELTKSEHTPNEKLYPVIEPLIQQTPLAIDLIPAGFPSPAEGYAEDYIDFNQYLIKNQAATFVVRCGGNSMLDAGIALGDLLIIDRSLKARNNDIVMADLGQEFTIKRLVFMPNGRVNLLSENKEEFHPSFEFGEGDELAIVGVVVHVLKSFRG